MRIFPVDGIMQHNRKDK